MLPKADPNCKPNQNRPICRIPMNAFTNSCGSVLVLVCGLSVGSPSLQAADWPQWRGPQRNGVSRETGLLKEWPKEGPSLVWQVKDIGSGFSTPSVVGERIYLLANSGLDNEFVQALAVKDGKPIWNTRLGKVGNPDQQPNY